MSNKRSLKQSINYACSELFAEGVAIYLSTSNDNHNQVDDILTSILKMHSDFIRRISHPEPGMKPKYYFGVLIKDFDKSVAEIIDQLQAVG